MAEKRETGRPGGAGRPVRSTEQHPTPIVLCCGIRLRRIPISPAPAAPGLHWRSRPPKSRAGTDVLCASPEPHLRHSLTLRTEGRARRGSARPLSARPRCCWYHLHRERAGIARPPRRADLRRAVAGTPVGPVRCSRGICQTNQKPPRLLSRRLSWPGVAARADTYFSCAHDKHRPPRSQEPRAGLCLQLTTPEPSGSGAAGVAARAAHDTALG